MATKRKKSKYRHVVINKKKYYFYKISWLDITADGGHATVDEFDKFECSRMITIAYLYKKIGPAHHQGLWDPVIS